MTAVWTLPITADDLLVVLADLWDAVFATTPTALAAEPPVERRLWSVVDLVDAGGPVVSVLLVSTPDTFRGLGRFLFGDQQPQQLHLEDMIGEAANIAAGNVKGILRLGTGLAVPRPGWGTEPALDPAVPVLSTSAEDDRGHWATIRVIDHRSPG